MNNYEVVHNLHKVVQEKSINIKNVLLLQWENKLNKNSKSRVFYKLWLNMFYMENKKHENKIVNYSKFYVQGIFVLCI